MEKRKLRGGMVGGGSGSLIGPVHRMAATIDGQAEIVAGVFSSDPEKSKRFGEELYLDPSRVYADYQEMAEKEAALPPDHRVDFVSIATPNVYHFDIARAFLKAGFSVICDKPMTCSLAEAKELKSIVAKSGKIFALTHTYTGYPMVKHARHIIRQGMLGKINKIVVDYPQGWLARLLESRDESIRNWRLDPQKSGISCCTADIGTHAENLVRYITGLEIEELCADLSCFVPGSLLDDDGCILIHYKEGARGIINVSQISTGEGCLNIRISGTKLSLSWHQEKPNDLICKDIEGCTTTYSKGSPVVGSEARSASRLPLGHTEGFIEAFANIYLETFKAIRAQLKDQPVPVCDYPTVDDGVIGMAFIETVVASAASNKKWTKML
ncbi:MAG: Gfo/Idh/MocA family oxidoreductase, partial [Dehalococcoidia bacterium]|nr:Gfo/Idh/MocA family oxidoreductase [Dehalococcoidia bacterium]